MAYILSYSCRKSCSWLWLIMCRTWWSQRETGRSCVSLVWSPHCWLTANISSSTIPIHYTCPSFGSLRNSPLSPWITSAWGRHMFAVNMLMHSSWKMLNIQYDKNKFTYFVCHYISVLYLRQFLCLGDPLMCSGENLLPVSCEEANCSSTVPPSPYRLPFWITSCFMKKKKNIWSYLLFEETA